MRKYAIIGRSAMHTFLAVCCFQRMFDIELVGLGSKLAFVTALTILNPYVY